MPKLADRLALRIGVVGRNDRLPHWAGRAYGLDPCLGVPPLSSASYGYTPVVSPPNLHDVLVAPRCSLSLALGALGLVACGASSHSPAPVATVGGPPANIVAPQQIALYPGGSPTHALLEFWQAVQFGDLLNARRLVSPETLAAVTPSRFTTMVQTLGDDIPGLQIVSSTQIGVNAAVRVFLLFYAPNRTVSASAPQTFSLRDGPLGYQLNDLAYFLRTARTVRAAQHKP